jgi:hypothetical protein
MEKAKRKSEDAQRDVHEKARGAMAAAGDRGRDRHEGPGIASAAD